MLAAFVPWLNGMTNSSAPVYVFNLVLIGIVGISLALNEKLQFRAYLWSWVFAALFCFGILMMFILHRLHPLVDFLVIVPVTLAYTFFLRNSALTSGELLRQVKWLYSFHILFIVFELLMFYFDARSIFHILSGDRYREFPFHLLSTIVLNMGNGAPNSFLLQTQAASHLVGCAFLLFYLASYDKRNGIDLTILFLLFLLFLLLITNMSLLVFVILAAAVWMIKATPKTKILASLSLISAGYIFFDEFARIILYRVYSEGSLNQRLFEEYLWYFTVPITNVLDAHPLQLVFGHGPDKDALESGELGFATMAFIGGVYPIGLLFIWLAAILIAGLIWYRRTRNTRDSTVAGWRSLLFINIVLCSAWAMSTGHYLIVLISGGMHLFAFSLAIVITAIGRLQKLRQVRHQEDLLAPLRHGYRELFPG